MSFLPDDYQAPKGGGDQYFKATPGEHTIRILDSPIIGHEGWADKAGGGREVHRVPIGEEMPKSFGDVKQFWALPIWDYSDSKIKIWTITQKTFIQGLTELARNEKWGSPINYDLDLKRTGTTRDDTEYHLTPSPPTPLSNEIAAAQQSTYLRLAALFENEDPFSEPNAHKTDGDNIPF